MVDIDVRLKVELYVYMSEWMTNNLIPVYIYPKIIHRDFYRYTLPSILI